MKSVIMKNAKKLYKLFFDSPKLIAVVEHYGFCYKELSKIDKLKLIKILGNKQFSIITDDHQFWLLRKMCCSGSTSLPFEIKESEHCSKIISFEVDSEERRKLNTEIYDIFLTVINEKNEKGKKSKDYKFFQNIEYGLKMDDNWHYYQQLYRLILLAKICKVNGIQYFDYFVYRFSGVCYNKGIYNKKVLSYIGFSQGRKQKRYLEHMNGNSTNSKIVLKNCDRATIKYQILHNLKQYNLDDFNMKQFAQEIEDDVIRSEKKSIYTCVNSNCANKNSEYEKCDICGKQLKKGSIKKHKETPKCKAVAVINERTEKMLNKFLKKDNNDFIEQLDEVSEDEKDEIE